tara:strand:- start:201 stop:2663 length:2463 start_codon:yes stop_codon:yes gene_type:complete
MKVSQNWLRELVEINANPEELAEKLSIGGFEVESLLNCALKVDGVVLGKVLSVEKHTNSEKLSICQVDIGSEKLQIICGAKNIRSNIFVYVATVGSYLESIDLKIQKSEIRGIISEGMICSLEELGLESKSEGIAIIDQNKVRGFKLGTTAAKILNLNDYIYDLAITANRPDGMSVIGIAREISALLETSLKVPVIGNDLNLMHLKNNSFCQEAINSECIYTISEINNVKGNIISPDWLKDRLEKSDINPINLLVDITNYILLEQGQPLHAFDKDKLSKIVGKEVSEIDFGVRKAQNKETFLALDNKKYVLNENITVITCANIPIAIAGVIGGIETAVSATTKNIYLEAAVFNPSTVRKSSKEIGIRTESSSRFEKGISSKNTIISVKRAVSLFNEFFEISKINLYSSHKLSFIDKKIKLRRERVHKILGPINIIEKNSNNLNKNKIKRYLKDSEIRDKLKLIGCTILDKDYGWDITVIANRSQDLTREIDLIEEVARLIGYDLFDQNIPNPINPGILKPSQKALRKLKDNFINVGFNEVLTYSLVPEKFDRIKISNPLLLETSSLRSNLWEEHIKICDNNHKAGKDYCWIFEIGNIFQDKNSFTEEELLSGIISGNNNYSKWDDSAKQKQINYFEARGKLKEALDSLNILINDKPTDKYNFLHPGMSSLLFIEGKEAGFFGQIHPRFLMEKKVQTNLYIFQLKVNNLLEASTRKNKWIPIYKNYPIVPKIDRDISLIFKKGLLVEDIISEIKRQGKKLLEDVFLIDIYTDKNIGDKNISYTFRLSYRDKDKTLMETDIYDLHNNLIAVLENKFKAKQNK